MNPTLLCLLLFSLLGVSSCSKQAQTRPNITFQKISSQGISHFIYVKHKLIKNKDPQDYIDISNYVCGKLSVCEVMFWNERIHVPFSLPMTDIQAQAQVAHYRKNKVKHLNELQLCAKKECR